MPNKKSPGCILYVLFTIIIFAFMVVLIVLSQKGIINTVIGYSGFIILIIIWFLISGIITRKQEANSPVLQSQAVLIEKLQEDRRNFTQYFLSFKLDDGDVKTISVERDIYAAFSKNQKGLLQYKQVNKADNYLSYRFLNFDVQ